MGVSDFAVFPRPDDDWADFVMRSADDRIASIRRLDQQLLDGSELPAAERLALWNETDVIAAQARGGAYLPAELHPDAEVRRVAETTAERVEAVLADRAQSRALWQAVSAIEPDGLDDVARRLREHVLRDFRRSGVELDDATRERARVLAQRETALSLAFSRNIREGRREITVRPEHLTGLPDDFLAAHPPGDDGLVVLSTDYPDLFPVREYATDPAVRSELLHAFNDLAWPENDAVLADLLEVRRERAAVLGYADWAEYETADRMIGSGRAIARFLDAVDAASHEAADREYSQLLTRLRRDDPSAQVVTLADYLYLLGAIRREEYDVDAQRVRSYLPFNRVLAGVLDIAGHLFDLEFRPVGVPTWHDDVRTYDVHRDGELWGRIHLDLHPREGKFNHAACFRVTRGVAGRTLPEGVLICNLSRGLLEHDDVVTLLHEFGHLMHDQIGGHGAVARFAGAEVEWDFVEAPSQMLEEWAWDPGVLASFAVDEAGEPIPADLVARLRVAHGFGRALEVRRSLGHARVSYLLHVEHPDDLQQAVEGWYSASSPVQPLAGGHTYAGFGHLTDYGACVYTYQWSLVIARDLLSAFGGDLMDPGVAARYRASILEPGGSRDAADLVTAFLGRPYRFDAYAAWLDADSSAVR